MEIREAEERYLVRKRCTTRCGGGDGDGEIALFHEAGCLDRHEKDSAKTAVK